MHRVPEPDTDDKGREDHRDHRDWEPRSGHKGEGVHRREPYNEERPSDRRGVAKEPEEEEKEPESATTSEDKKEEGADEEESKDGFNAPKQDDDEKADKVDNEPEKEIDQEGDSANDETTQVTTTTATVSDNEEAEPVSKFMLLDRLFKFIESESEDQVNPVLAGYFSKVV